MSEHISSSEPQTSRSGVTSTHSAGDPSTEVSGHATFDDQTCERCRQDFPSLRRSLAGKPLAFLDGPGGTQVPDCVIEAVSDCYRSRNVNTHGNFPPSQELDERLLGVRAALADFMGAESPRCISLGQNMTTLTFSLARAIGRGLAAGDEILITQLDHEANRGPWQRLSERGAVIEEVPLLPDGELDYLALQRLLTERTRVLALGCSSNAIGTVNDLKRARALTRDAGALLVLDAVHYAPHFPIDVRELDPDFLLCSAYKFYGPHVGVMYSRAGALEALDTDRLSVQDGSAPTRIETGTMNHPALEGVTAAVDYLARFGVGATRRARVHSALAAISRYEHDLGQQLWAALRQIPGAKLWGVAFGSRLRAPTVGFTLQGIQPERFARAAGAAGICIWDGNFYAPRPLQVLGVPHGALLRVGFSMYNTREECERLIELASSFGSRS